MMHPSLSIRAIGRHFARLLLFSGVAILGYAGFQYSAMLVEQHRLQGLWREQQKVDDVGAESHRQNAAWRSGTLSRITIPSIQLSAVIVEGTDLLSLMIGPGHLTGTVEPGEQGNAVVSAHRDTFFRNITRIGAGDRILIERGGQTFTYAVEGIRIVNSTDVSVLTPTTGNLLTLITCEPAYYPGPAPRRLVVVSRMIDPQPSSQSIEASKQTPSQVKQVKQSMRRPHPQSQ